MVVYIFTILFLSFLAYWEIAYKPNNELRRYFLFLVFMVLSLQMGLRWEMGTDWLSYRKVFDRVDDLKSAMPEVTYMEIGYGLLIYFTKLITDDYSFFLLIHAFLYYAILLRGISRLTAFPTLATLLLYCFTMGVTGSNRQLIAVALVLYSLKFVIDRKLVKFVLTILLAFFFHTTVLIALPIYFLNRNINAKIFTVLIILAIAFGKSTIPYKIFSVLGGGISTDKVDAYLESADSSIKEYNVGIIGLVKRVLFGALFIYTSQFLHVKNKFYTVMLNGYLLGLVIYFMFSSSLLILVSRGGLYFNALEPILLSCQLYLVKSVPIRVMLLVLGIGFAFVYFYQSIAQYPDLFIPYKGIFINQDYQRELY